MYGTCMQKQTHQHISIQALEILSLFVQAELRACFLCELGGRHAACEVEFFVAQDFAVGAVPFFFFDEDHAGCDGSVVAVLVPGRVASVAEDDLVAAG